eukprot:7377832-Prymnesium_polylepis.1
MCTYLPRTWAQSRRYEVRVAYGCIDQVASLPKLRARQYSTYSVSGYSSDTTVVYKYSRYRRIGVGTTDTADTADTALIQQQYSSDTADTADIADTADTTYTAADQQLQCRYNNRPQWSPHHTCTTLVGW